MTSRTTNASSSLVKTCLPHTCRQLQMVFAGMVGEQQTRWCRKGADVLQRCVAPAGKRWGRDMCRCMGWALLLLAPDCYFKPALHGTLTTRKCIRFVIQGLPQACGQRTAQVEE